MSESPTGNRARLARECLLFQVKLFADGLRDFLLVPISLVAAAVGLLRSAEDPDREFRRVIRLGIQSERWINLFGQHEPIIGVGDAGSIDRLVTRAEEVVREQYRQGGISRGATNAIERALARLHERAGGEPAEAKSEPSRTGSTSGGGEEDTGPGSGAQ